MTLEAWVNPATAMRAGGTSIYKGNDNYYLEATSTAAAGRPAGAHVGGSHRRLRHRGAGREHVGASGGDLRRRDVRLYVNGAQVSSVGRDRQHRHLDQPAQIGGDSIYGQYFSGLIDEVRVYNTALTAAQIQTDMTTPVGARRRRPTRRRRRRRAR